jgi:hypothetical protein
VLVGGDSDLLLMALASGAVARGAGTGLPGDLRALQPHLTTTTSTRAASRPVVRGLDASRVNFVVASFQPPSDVYFSAPKMSIALEEALARAASEASSPPWSCVAVHEASLDLVALLVLGAGNDYLPALHQLHTPMSGLWQSYLTSIATAETGPLVLTESTRGRGDGGGDHDDGDTDGAFGAATSHVNRRALAALLVDATARPPSAPPAKPPTALEVARFPSRGFTFCRPDRVRLCLVSPPPFSRQVAAAPAYLAALEWNLDMYLRGECPDYRTGFVAPTSVQALLALCRAEMKRADMAQATQAAGVDEVGTDANARAVAAAAAALAEAGAHSPPPWQGWEARRWQLPATRETPPQMQKHHPSPSPPRRLPPPPAIYNLLVQPLGGAGLVAAPLRRYMKDDLSPIRWLYAHGCRCATCGVIRSEVLPLSQRISAMGKVDPEDTAAVVAFHEVRPISTQTLLYRAPIS